MFSLVYVILPFSEIDPSQAIEASLARFQNGRRGDVPDEWLRFHDETAVLRSMHEKTYSFTRTQGLRVEGGLNWYLSYDAITSEMDRRGKKHWSVRFADKEPDLAAFVRRYCREFERHPVTGSFGYWLNGLGRWDWWDLGGRYAGRISGSVRRHERPQSTISSGPSRGRDVLDNVYGALNDAFGQATPAQVDVHTDDNIELVSRLLEDLRSGLEHALPLSLVLPPGSADDSLRWIGTWPQLGPMDAILALGLPADAKWRQVAETVYGKFADHWAAGVAYHH